MVHQLAEDMISVRIYLDNVVNFSKNSGEHVEHIKLVAKLVALLEFKPKISKCEFPTDDVSTLGHVVSKRGV